MFCKNCGKQIDIDSNFCSGCGLKTNSQQSIEPIKEEIILSPAEEAVEKFPNSTIQAIKYLRDKTGMSLRDAKDAVEAISKKMPDTRNNTKKNKMASLAIFLLFILIILIIAINGGKDILKSDNNSSNNKTSNSSNFEVEETIEITAEDLIKAYDENGVSADTKYKGKKLRVTGIVNSINKDIFDKAYVKLNDGDEYSLLGVQCYFDKNNIDSISQLKKGNTITIEGVCTGSSLSVILENSTVIK